MTTVQDNADRIAVIEAERDRLLEIITALGLVSSSAGTTQTLMDETVGQVMRLTRAAGAVLELVSGTQLEYRAVAGTVTAYAGLRLDAATSLSGLCVARRQIMYSRDTHCDPRVDAAACKKISARSMLVVPLVRGAESVGVLKAVSAVPDGFDQIDGHALSLFAVFIGGVIARQGETERSAALAAEMERRALRDELTGLPNRSAWLEELERGIVRARRAHAPIAVLYLDLDGFKAVNDRHGHAAGDEVLKTFAGQLRSCMRASDFVARLAGDEFAVLVEGSTDVERDALAVVAKITEAAAAGTPWHDTVLECAPSIGIAFDNGPAYSVDALMGCADEAMYRAKKERTGFTVSNCAGGR